MVIALVGVVDLPLAGVYQAVHNRLNAGGCIGIFPEGGSHDRAEMLPLKAGVTLMVRRDLLLLNAT